MLFPASFSVAFTDRSALARRLRTCAERLPSQCAVCHAWPAQRVCAACVARFAQAVPRCRRCALRLPDAAVGVERCGACLKKPPLFDACLAAFDYAYPWAAALADFKFHGDPGWSAALADLMRSAPGVAAALDAAQRVLPLPLSAERLRERGFNQSALLARRLAGGKLDTRSLLRLRGGEAQSGLTRAQRLRNLRGAFAVAPGAALRGQHLLLLDDVMTTGASAQAASRALRAGGAQQITVLVLARTPHPARADDA